MNRDELKKEFWMVITDYNSDKIGIDKSIAKLFALFDQQSGKVLKMDRTRKRRCRWKYDDNYDIWETSCGEEFTLNEGTPEDNKMEYCPYCGKLIAELKKGLV